MTAPLILLSVFAAFCAVGGEAGPLFREILASEPAGLADGVPATSVSHIALPSHEQVHANHATAGGFALLVAVVGTVIAYFFYGAGKYKLNPGEVQARFSGLHAFLAEKWQFDTLYDVMFVRPVHVVASWAAAIDKYVFDGFLHTCARGAVQISHWDRLFDEAIIDGLVNWFGNTTHSTGYTFRRLQTGRLRQYVMFIVVGVVIVGGFGLFWLLRLQGA
jgi:NADH:ubiquinone oxidoreductase subunit 5 (subunit L)/multisubunit Na+/H+ antiporter MnhA subunit